MELHYMRKFEASNMQSFKMRLLAGLFSISLIGCASSAETDDTPPSESVKEFIADSGATTIYPNARANAGRLPAELQGEYNEFPKYKPQDELDDDLENGLAFSPRRFQTSFKEGDGSGSDTVCQDLTVPSSADYVQAVTNSDKAAWVAYDGEENIAYLCYSSTQNPDTVAVWAGNTPR